MKLLKQVVIIAFVSQVAYWLLAALLFGKDQLLLHSAAAIVIAAFITSRCIKYRSKLVWLAPVLWIGLVWLSYELISDHARLINWTLDYVPTTALAWNAVRVVDMGIISAIIGLIVIAFPKFLPSGKMKKIDHAN